MYQFMAEMSPRRQKMLFAAGVYVLWSGLWFGGGNIFVA